MRPDVALAVRPHGRGRRRRRRRADLVSAVSHATPSRRVLFAAHPDPKWVAPAGRLAAPARHRARPRSGVRLRAGWPPTRRASTSCSATRGSPGTTASFSTPAPPRSAIRRGAGGEDGAAGGRCRRFVPERYAPAIARAAQRWSVSGRCWPRSCTQESGFNPFARIDAPGRAASRSSCPRRRPRYGLRDPLRRGGGHRRPGAPHARPAAPLRLGAAGAGRLQRRPGAGRTPAAACRRYPETPAYVAAILGLLDGAGDALGAGVDGLEVRLVR